MPERIGTVRYDTEDVQGVGSWVEMAALTWGEAMDIRQRVEDESRLFPTLLARIRAILAWVGFAKLSSALEREQRVVRWALQRVIAWNWVDSGGNPLPLPSEQRDITYRITLAEAQCIVACANGNRRSAERKNSSTGLPNSTEQE